MESGCGGVPYEPGGHHCGAVAFGAPPPPMPTGFNGSFGADELPPELAALVHQTGLASIFCRQNRDKFKTEMCRNWMSVGVCRYGDKW